MMSDVNATIGGRKVVSSGSLIAYTDDRIELRPFSDDPSYLVSLEISFVEKGGRTSVSSDGDSGVVVRASGVFGGGNPFSSSRYLKIASDERTAYYLALYITPAGAPEKHTLLINYTVVEGE